MSAVDGSDLLPWLTDDELRELEAILCRNADPTELQHAPADLERIQVIMEAGAQRKHAAGGAPSPSGGYRGDAAQT